jgi:RNA 2',3'-cyclic 3'-phosphodiesterase
MRLFIAIGLPESWKEILAEPQKHIGWLGRGVRWVEPRGMHLTLVFLGEVEDSQLPAIENCLETACRECAPFSMRLKGTGTFPNPKRPRVYWAGIDAPRTLLDLQARIEACTVALGFEKEEREFRPHLTLARIKEPIGKDRMTDALLKFKLESEPLAVSEVLLMQSHLSSDGATYEALRRFPLTGSAPKE